MNKQIVVLFLVFLIIATIASAELKKGSVGAGGHKGYSFFADNNGQVTITLVFDNAAADLDVASALISQSGEVTLIGADVSTMKNFAQIQFGVPYGLQVFLIVNSYKGASPYRICVTSAGDQTSVRPNEAMEIEPVMLDELASYLNRIKHK